MILRRPQLISTLACLWIMVTTIPLATAFTRTSTQIGPDFTSYWIFVNDGGPESTFIGIPKTTTDKDGDISTYLSPEYYQPHPTSLKTYTPSSSPTPTENPTATQSSHDETSKNSSSETEVHEKTTNVGAIAGGVVGGVVVLIAVGVGVWFLVRKRIRQRQREEHEKEELQLLAMGIGGAFQSSQNNSKNNPSGGGGDTSLYSSTRANVSITDDLASMYNSGSTRGHHLPTLKDTYSYSALPMNIGAELTMDSQGRHGMPDGSPLIIDSIMPIRNVKMADNYADLEWFPLATPASNLQRHSGPKYVYDQDLAHVASSLSQKSPISRIQQQQPKP